MLGLGATASRKSYAKPFQRRVFVGVDGTEGEWEGHSQSTDTIAKHIIHDDGSDSQLSISVWIKLTTTSPGEEGAIVSCGTAYGDKKEWALEFLNVNNRLGFIVSPDGTSTNHVLAGSTATNSINDTDWHHVAVRYDGSEGTAADRVQFWIDGSSVTTTGHSSSPARIYAASEDNGRLNLGCWNQAIAAQFTPAYEFQGNYDQVFIIPRYVFDDDDVTEFFNGGVPKNMASFQSSNSNRLYYRADNYAATLPAPGVLASHDPHIAVFDSLDKGIGPELWDTDKIWGGSEGTISVTVLLTGDATRTHIYSGHAEDSVLDGLPSDNEGCIKCVDEDVDNTQIFRIKFVDENMSKDSIAGKTYQIGAWMRVESGDTLGISWVNGGSVRYVYQNFSSTDWVYFQDYIQAKDTASHWYITGSANTEIFYITGFSCKELNSRALVSDGRTLNALDDWLPISKIKVG